jgi:hypothetical protein
VTTDQRVVAKQEIQEVESAKLGGQGEFLIDRLRPSFYNFIFTFPEFTFHDFSQAPHFK